MNLFFTDCVDALHRLADRLYTSYMSKGERLMASTHPLICFHIIEMHQPDIVMR